MSKQISKTDYKKLFHDWYEPMENVIHRFITKEFLGKIHTENMRPDADKVFRAFYDCSYEKVKVVIIGQDPYTQPGVCTGLAFANGPETLTISPSLKKIHEALENSVGLRLDFDITLKSWANQGVLLLNSALTVNGNFRNSHLKYWYPFLSRFLIELANQKDNLVFLCWGSIAARYGELIDHGNHLVCRYEHPAKAVRENKKWNMDGFIIANEYLKINNKTKINW